MTGFGFHHFTNPLVLSPGRKSGLLGLCYIIPVSVWLGLDWDILLGGNIFRLCMVRCLWHQPLFCCSSAIGVFFYQSSRDPIRSNSTFITPLDSFSFWGTHFCCSCLLCCNPSHYYSTLPSRFGFILVLIYALTPPPPALRFSFRS